jgi:hypothetical protein
MADEAGAKEARLMKDMKVMEETRMTFCVGRSNGKFAPLASN